MKFSELNRGDVFTSGYRIFIKTDNNHAKATVTLYNETYVYFTGDEDVEKTEISHQNYILTYRNTAVSD